MEVLTTTLQVTVLVDGYWHLLSAFGANFKYEIEDYGARVNDFSKHLTK